MKPIATLLIALLTFNLCMAQNTFTTVTSEKVPVQGDELKPGFFTLVEKMPAYPSGDNALIQWISNEMTYPKEAKKKRIEGVVYVNYVVGVDGSIDSVSVLRSVHPLLDEEAVRVISLIKGYTPGYQRGKPVRVQFTIPLRFKL